MIQSYSFKATGHPNITSKHKTTLMTTRDKHLTKKGTCIIAVNSGIGLNDLPEKLKKLAKNFDASITFQIKAGNKSLTVAGKGDPGLTFSDTNDIVVRKSKYICGRTLMIQADKAAIDIQEDLIKALQEENQDITITISVYL